LFEAGRAAALRGRSRWTTAWATAACLFAATTVGLLVTRTGGPIVDGPPIAERDADRSVEIGERSEVFVSPPRPRSMPESIPVESGTLRAADRRLEALPAPEVGPLVAVPAARPPVLTPIRAWRDVDSI
jgi:hypothetical protein